MVVIDYSEFTNLGNWMFKYAIAKSRSLGDDVAFYVRPELGENHVRKLQARADVLRGLRVIREIPSRAELFPPDILQRPDLFDEVRVRELFRMPDDIREHLVARFGERMRGRTCVGVSVRRGDYMRLPHRHPFVGRRFLAEAVGRFPQTALFVVCSDDLAWCKRFFAKGCPDREFLYVEDESVPAQLYVQSLCDHNVISNSTFSWWGAWLNAKPGRRVIFPRHWYGMLIGRRISDIDLKRLMLSGGEIIENGYEARDFVLAVVMTVLVWCGRVARRLHLRK